MNNFMDALAKRRIAVEREESLSKNDIPLPPKLERLTKAEKEELDDLFGVYTEPNDEERFALSNVRNRAIYDNDSHVVDLVVMLYNYLLGTYEYDAEFARWMRTKIKLFDNERLTPFERIEILALRLRDASSSSEDNQKYAVLLLNTLNEISFRDALNSMIKAYSEGSEFPKNVMFDERDLREIPGTRNHEIVKKPVAVEAYETKLTERKFPFVLESKWLRENIVYIVTYDGADGIWVSGVNAQRLIAAFSARGVSAKVRFDLFRRMKQHSFEFGRVVLMCKTIRDANVFEISDDIEWMYATWLPQFYHSVTDDAIRDEIDNKLHEDGTPEFSLRAFMLELYDVVHRESIKWVSKTEFMNQVYALRDKTDGASNNMREYLTDYLAQVETETDAVSKQSMERWMASFTPGEIRAFKEIVWSAVGKKRKYATFSNQIGEWANKKANYLASSSAMRKEPVSTRKSSVASAVSGESGSSEL